MAGTSSGQQLIRICEQRMFKTCEGKFSETFTLQAGGRSTVVVVSCSLLEEGALSISELHTSRDLHAVQMVPTS